MYLAPQLARFLSRLAGVALVCAVLAALSTPAAYANASIFNIPQAGCSWWCTSLSDFGVLTGLATTNTITSNGGVTFNGGIGIQSGDRINVSGGNLVDNDIIDYADPISRGGTCSSSIDLCGAGNLNGVKINGASTIPRLSGSQSSLISKANGNLSTIETWLGSLNGTYATLPTAAGTYDFTTGANAATSLGISTPQGGGVYAYQYTGTSISNALTFGCAGSTATCGKDLLVIVLASSSAITFSKNFLIADGLTSDQVIFYAPNTSSLTLTASAAMEVDGDFFYNSTTTLTLGGSKGLNLSGRYYGGSITDTNTGTITQSDPGLATPEPAAWASLAGGLAALLFLHRRRTRAKRGAISA